jgi:hypothetical protein
VADIAVGVAGQQNQPIMFTYQTGGAYASDTQSMPQAQPELALEMPNWFLVAPVYPLIDKPTGHLDANSYRWLDAQFGKVMHRVLTVGEDWKPSHPLRAIVEGISVLWHFMSRCHPWFGGGRTAALPRWISLSGASPCWTGPARCRSRRWS